MATPRVVVDHPCADCGLVRKQRAYLLNKPDFMDLCRSCSAKRRRARPGGLFHVAHGECGTRLYIAWSDMKKRCFRPQTPNYANYGGRGITVCERWLKYENFRDDMGHPPEGTSLERIDNDGPYSPENCRWASDKDQCNNTRQNHLLSYEGKTQTLKQWSTETGIKYETLANRIRRGWSVAVALSPELSQGIKGGIR